MAAAGRPPYRWSVKPPPGMAEVDPDGPLAVGLYDLVLYNEGDGAPWNLSTGSPTTLLGGSSVPVWEPGEVGWGLRPGGLLGGGRTTASCAAIPDHGNLVAGDFTILVRFVPYSASGVYNGLFEKDIGGGGGRELALFYDASYTVDFTTIGQSSTNPGTLVFTPGVVNTLVLLRRGGTAWFYLGGVPIVSFGSPGTSGAPGASLMIGGQSSFNTNPDVSVSQFASWTRALDDAEVERVSLDPQALLLPPPSWRVGMVGAAPPSHGTLVLTTSSGPYAWSY